MKSGPHPSHQTRISMGASTYDEICTICGATDEVPGGWGRLAEPCPGPVSVDRALADGRAIPLSAWTLAMPAITCPRCGMVSYHPKDVSERYCGHCHEFHEHMKETP